MSALQWNGILRIARRWIEASDMETISGAHFVKLIEFMQLTG